jgi:hypothetical protein
MDARRSHGPRGGRCARLRTDARKGRRQTGPAAIPPADLRRRRDRVRPVHARRPVSRLLGAVRREATGALRDADRSPFEPVAGTAAGVHPFDLAFGGDGDPAPAPLRNDLSSPSHQLGRTQFAVSLGDAGSGFAGRRNAARNPGVGLVRRLGAKFEARTSHPRAAVSSPRASFSSIRGPAAGNSGRRSRRFLPKRGEASVEFGSRRTGTSASTRTTATPRSSSSSTG